jgi:predicted N-acetyltransferase YhbS
VDEQHSTVSQNQIGVNCGSSVGIRAACASDAAVVCGLLRRSIVECCVEDHRNDEAILDSWLRNKNTETVTAWFSSPANFSVVATLGGEVVGVGLLTRKGKIALCHVVPEVRFTGTGKALLNALETQATAWRMPSVQVASTLGAQAFYLRNGYAPLRETESSFGIEATLFTKKLLSGSSARRAAPYGACRCSGNA